ncbi:uncharacterized protein LOC118504676 isoform X6 [Anopheles stephensi]|uniref:uncharacterized protein LOC118504676 isoform X6 n=1 Tax=Anopheles stephensi TaxID=30069 RepID=UPI0016588EA6|nr:uncharacterized protein LOC118504676 isoform X6 [Anopheles stephensi]
MEEEQRRLSQQFETPGTALLQPGYGQPLPSNAPAVEQQGSQASSVHFSPSLSSAPTSLHPPSLAPAASMQHPPSLPGVSQNGEPTMYQIMQLLRQLMTKIEQQPPASLPTNASQQQLPVVHPPSASQQQPLVSEIASQPQQQHRSAPANPEQILDSLARNITEFRFEAEAGLTFEAWYSRYEDLFVSDAARIDDAAKVRMLMRKLGSMEHESNPIPQDALWQAFPPPNRPQAIAAHLWIKKGNSCVYCQPAAAVRSSAAAIRLRNRVHTHG